MSDRTDPFNDDLDIISNFSKVPILFKKVSNNAPDKEEELIMEENMKKENKLNSTMRLLDPKLEIQIFNGPRMKPLHSLVIKKIKQLGGGA